MICPQNLYSTFSETSRLQGKESGSRAQAPMRRQRASGRRKANARPTGWNRSLLAFMSLGSFKLKPLKNSGL